MFSVINYRTPKNKFNFQTKDKVCCTKNGYVLDQEKRSDVTVGASQDYARSSHDNGGKQRQDQQAKEKKERLCNGEIFFIDNVLEFYLSIYLCIYW